jgi:hypothetical protein
LFNQILYTNYIKNRRLSKIKMTYLAVFQLVLYNRECDVQNPPLNNQLELAKRIKNMIKYNDK